MRYLNLRIRRSSMVFVLAVEQWTNFSLSAGCMGVRTASHHVFCGLGDGVRTCTPGILMLGVPWIWVYWVWGIRSLYDRCQSLASIVSRILLQHGLDSAKAALCHRFRSLLLWTEFLGVVWSSQYYIAAFCRWCGTVSFFKLQSSTVTGAVRSRVWSGWNEDQHLQSETMVLKRVEYPPQVWDEILPLVEEFNYLGFLFMSEGI